MATTKSKTKPARKKAAKAKKPAKPITPAQEAHQITWLILGELKSLRIKFLRVGKLLCEVRDRKLYQDLKFKDMESYAWARLRLRRSSYYQYVQVYDWVAAAHPQWLRSQPKGFMPDLADAADLMWIEQELRRTDLSTEYRAAIEALQKKALAGTLKENELDKLRKTKNTTKDAFKSMLSRVRNVRNYGKKLAHMPAEVLALLDSAIALLQKAFDDENAKK